MLMKDHIRYLMGFISNGNIDERTAQGILERTVRLLPELSHGKGVQGLDIVRHNVGLRPTREGGPRMENETRS